MNFKKYEIILVFIIIGVVLSISSGQIINIIEKANKTSAETQTKALINTAEQMYIESYINGKDKLPFVVIFENNEMYLKTGSPSKTYIYDGTVKTNGKYPNSGEIIILNNERIIVNNLKIRDYICNTLKDDELICKKAWL